MRGIGGWLALLIVLLGIVGPLWLLLLLLSAWGMAVTTGALPAAIWTLYLRRSRRVANTYTLGGDVADVFR